MMEYPLAGLLLGAAFIFAITSILIHIYTHFIRSPLRAIPGPRLFALTRWRLAYEDYRGTRTRCIHRLHAEYGDVVRVGPTEISFNSLSALRTIYGAGNGFQRNSFYRMFDVYGRQCMFSFASSEEHRERKKLLNHAYSKTSVLSTTNAAMIEEKTRQFLQLIESESDSKSGTLEIFSALHYFSMDSITQFLYGAPSPTSPGATTALTAPNDRRLLADILDPARRKLSWFAVHLPRLTSWLYSRTGILDHLISSLGLLPMDKPATYTGIRAHALIAAQSLEQATSLSPADSIAARLLSSSAFTTATTKIQQKPTLDILDIASECADQFLAGIDTTSDTLMFAIFLLSQPENKLYLDRLRAELCSSSPSPSPSAENDSNPQDQENERENLISSTQADKLPYLDAIIRETLRLFAPLPGSEPRWSPRDETIDRYLIPAGTVVSMSPYTLHRNEQVFTDPLTFNPERWLLSQNQGGEIGGGGTDERRLAEMKKWFWAFSSGGRMCIGMHLAMAEMTTLLANVYRRYRTEIAPGFEGVSPGVTARYEVFSDERFARVEEHTCWIRFKRC